MTEIPAKNIKLIYSELVVLCLGDGAICPKDDHK